MNRNSYIVGKAFRSFLFATVLATVASSLAVSVDSLIVGNLLGAEPLAALSLITPVAQIYNAISALINVGGAVVASQCIGKQDIKRAGAVCMTSLFLSLCVGVAIMLVGAFALPAISGLLTTNEALRPLAEKYLRIMLLSAPIYLLLPGLCVFIRTDNAAKRASLALVVGNVANLILDIVFIRVLKMGIAGSSLATTCGYTLGLAIALIYFSEKKDRVFNLCRPCFSHVRLILVSGTPVALASALTCVRVYCTNNMVQSFLGAETMPLMAVCFNLMMLASMFIGGVSQSFQPVGGILIGMGDARGLHMVAKKAWIMLGSCLGVLLLFALAAPGVWLSIFGLAATVEAEATVRLFALSLPLYGACYFLMVNYQTLGKAKLSLVCAAIDSIIVIAAVYCMALAGRFWCGFAVGEAAVLLVTVCVSASIRRKDNTVSPLLLLPHVSADAADFSTRADMAELPEAMEEISAFLIGHGEKNAINHVQLCCEEMLAVTRSDTVKNSAYADIRLHKEKDSLVLCIVTEGSRLDISNEKKDNLSLKLCDAMCTEMKHSYIAGQNVAKFVFALT